MEEISLILPCGGKSSRFTGKPKWLKTCPNGNLMIIECLLGLNLDNVSCLYVTFVKDHIDKYLKNIDLNKLFLKINKKIIFTILDNFTSSQSETVFETISINNIKGNIFIKDCDNFYEFKIEKGNYCCFLEVNKDNEVDELYNKGFLEINQLNQIVNICDKKIISNKISIGGYSFNDSEIFCKYYSDCIKMDLDNNELFLTHVIYKCILENIIFDTKKVVKYIDWGTEKQWNKYKNEFKTLFVDIDGTLFYNTGEYFNPGWGNNKPIIKNINKLREMYQNNKTQIILTTARNKNYEDVTRKQLEENNVPYHDIIFNLLHCKRYLINDYADSNKYPSAVAINLKRDNDNLVDYF